MPTTCLGKWGLWTTVAGIAAMLFVLPLITVNFRDTYPITDSWVMPTIGMIIVDAAALLNALAVWRAGERSVLARVFLVISGLFALLVTAMIVGEGALGA